MFLQGNFRHKGKKFRLTLQGNVFTWERQTDVISKKSVKSAQLSEIVTCWTCPNGHYACIPRVVTESETECQHWKKGCGGFSVEISFRKSNPHWSTKVLTFKHSNRLLIRVWYSHICQALKALADRPKRLLVLINPVSGRKRSQSIYAKKVSPLFSRARIETTVLQTEYKGHGTILIRESASSGHLRCYDGIVAVGGDGLASEVVTGLFAQDNSKDSSIGNDSSHVKESSFGKDSSVGKDSSIVNDSSSDLSLENISSHGKNSFFGNDSPFGKDSSIEKDSSIGKDYSCGKDSSLELSLGSDSSHGKDSYFGNDSSVGKYLSFGNDSSPGKDSLLGTRDSPFGNDSSVETENSPFESDSLLKTQDSPFGNDSSVETEDLSFGKSKLEFPNWNLRVGIIPSGSTDATCFATHGCNDALTAALHIVMGDRRAVDIASLHSDGKLQRVVTSLISYGYFGDVLQSSENWRWIGPPRYVLSGVGQIFRNRAYPVRMKVKKVAVDSSTDGLICSSQSCSSFCGVCMNTSNSSSDENSEEWQEVFGKFSIVSAAVTSCACRLTPLGVSPMAHLGDGCTDLILVEGSSRLNLLQYLFHTGVTGTAANLNYVKMIRTDEVHLFAPKDQVSSFNCDGEELKSNYLVIKIHRQKLPLFCRGIENNKMELKNKNN